MKKLIIVLLAVCLLSLTACTGTHVESDYPSAIMIDNTIYHRTITEVEVDENAEFFYPTSYTDSYPNKNGETNFDRELKTKCVMLDEGLAVNTDGTWYLCVKDD
ncbi:MAG: hypothetical protein R3Y35_09065 [Clostridia bacterium]